MIQQDREFADDIRKVQAMSKVPLLLDVCSAVTGMGFTAIARVTEDRWITCASLDQLKFGLEPGDELEVQSTICNQVRTCRELVVIDDVVSDAIYRDHPTPARYGFRSYISVPIVLADGSFFGTLCAIDPEPRQINRVETVGMFELFADLVATEIDLHDRLDDSERSLVNERETARLREEFIAVVGHDLRNPVAALSAGMRTLRRGTLGAGPSDALIGEMQSVVLRMATIVDNLLDFARGRLGDGITANLSENVDVARVVQAVADETGLVVAQPVDLRLAIDGGVRCDPQRIGQLVSNLIGNAVAHGAHDTPVLIDGRTEDGMLRLSVTNRGTPIPAEVMPSLFLPFARGTDRIGKDGLGLGLYIAAQIAQAHGGTIDATSDMSGTTFRFEMPVGGPPPV